MQPMGSFAGVVSSAKATHRLPFRVLPVLPDAGDAEQGAPKT
jgi:hypothetical protein